MDFHLHFTQVPHIDMCGELKFSLVKDNSLAIYLCLAVTVIHQGPLLLTLFNFNPSMDK